jgi:hypothetical protein
MVARANVSFLWPTVRACACHSVLDAGTPVAQSRQMRSFLGLVRTGAVATMVAACTSSGTKTPADVPPLQMNDLSVMFPLATSPGDFATYPSPTSPGAGGGALLPEALYTSDPIAGEIPYDGLRVVAFRLDPCFGHVGEIESGASCDDQIRLVFQPLQLTDGGSGAGSAAVATDAAVHVSYSITREQLLAAVAMIATARAHLSDADLGPLAVHPLVLQGGLGGTFAKQLRSIIATYADSTKIERITSFAVIQNVSGQRQDPPEPGDDLAGILWTMHGFDVASDQETALAIPTLASDSRTVQISAVANPLDASLSPTTTSTDAIGVLANANTATSAAPSAQQAAFDAALRIENPLDHSPNTIDCASCHMAEPVRTLVGEQVLGMSETGDPNRFAADPSIPSGDLTATTAVVDPGEPGLLNIHAFSYRASSPMINLRVINETAQNLAYLQSQLASAE